MAGSSAWTYAEWSPAVPPVAIVRLAVARALRDRAPADAEAVLDAVLALADSPPSGPAARAVHVAAVAEALALKQRWEPADERYREAIELMPDPTIRRSFWMNLAEIALRQNDETNRQKALEAARGNDSNDEIARRAVELLKYRGLRSDRLDGRDSSLTPSSLR
jgi:hypothetical protein